MAKKVITAHELARQLLAGPDVEVWARNPSDESYPLYVKKIEGIGQYGSADDEQPAFTKCCNALLGWPITFHNNHR